MKNGLLGESPIFFDPPIPSDLFICSICHSLYFLVYNYVDYIRNDFVPTHYSALQCITVHYFS